MALPKYASKVDKNQAEIVQALQAVGATVHVLKKPVDLLVGYRGVNYLLEVKNKAGRNRDTPDQLKFYDAWKGTVNKVWTVDDALEVIGAVKRG